MSAAIVTNDGTRVPLFTNTMSGSTAITTAGAAALKLTSGKQEGSGLQSLPFLESLTIKLDMGYLPKITAVLSPPYRDGQKFLDSPLMEWGMTTLEVQFGYSSGTPQGSVLSPLFQGLVLKPDISIGTQYSITLNAMGAASYRMTVDQRAEHLPYTNRFDIIKAVAARVGLEVGHQISSPEVANALFTDTVNEFQSWRTDWAFIWQLVRDCGCWMLVNDKKLLILERNAALSARPKYTLRLFDFDKGRLGPIQGDFPILSISSPTTAVYLPGSTRASIVQGINSQTGAVVNDSSANDDTLAPTRVGGGGVRIGLESKWNAVSARETMSAEMVPAVPAGFYPQQQTVSEVEGAAYPGDPNFDAVFKAAKAEYAAAFTAGITLEVNTLGIPDVVPGDILAVEGVSGRFNFNYVVQSVVHTLGTGGYTSQFSMLSNSSNVFRESAAKGKVNTSKPVEEPDKSQVSAKAMEELNNKGAINSVVYGIDNVMSAVKSAAAQNAAFKKAGEAQSKAAKAKAKAESNAAAAKTATAIGERMHATANGLSWLYEVAPK
jgi:hypothetical protein